MRPGSVFPAGIAGLIAVGLIAAPAAAQDMIDRIDLPDGWQPEGITADGTTLYAGSLADGAIWAGDATTGEGAVLVPGNADTVAAGVEAEMANGRLWAAGANTGEVRAYDSATGELLETYPLDAGFLNDIAATPEAVYITDSFLPQVLVVPIADDGALAAPEDAFSLPISGALKYGDGFNVNGIVAAPAGLIVIHSGNGELFRIDPATGKSERIDSGDTSLVGGDGLELDGSTLHVVRNRSNLVVSLALDDGATTATLIGDTTSDDFDVPTTAALVGDDLWAVNARFGTAGDGDDSYWITRIDAPSGE